MTARPRAAAVRLAAALLAAAGATGCAQAAPQAAGAPAAARQGAGGPYRTGPLIHPAHGKYLGVEPSGPPGAMTAVNSFAASAGRRPDIIGDYVGWGQPFNPEAAARAWRYGALYYLAWEPARVSLAAIAAGRWDRYLRGFARAVRALGLPVIISFGHEMNGFWYPWGAGRVRPAVFVAAWRHIHTVFVTAGATSVIWMWNPNVINPVPQVRLRPYYPGDAYVDWIGLTGYFATTGAHTYATLYQPTIRDVRRFTRKPVLIAETSVESGPAELACARNLVAAVARHRELLGFIWFDYRKQGVDWRIESRPALRAALARRLAGLPLVRVP